MSEPIKELIGLCFLAGFIALIIFFSTQCQRSNKEASAKCFAETKSPECWK